MKNKVINRYLLILQIFNVKIKGSNKTISTSKIKKITAIKKNCNEKGSRADDFGSNPHSKGEFFSRSENVFFDKIDASLITMMESSIRAIAILVIIIIIYTKN